MVIVIFSNAWAAGGAGAIATAIVDALVKASHQRGARASDARVHATQLRKADALTARYDSPEGVTMQARLYFRFRAQPALDLTAFGSSVAPSKKKVSCQLTSANAHQNLRV
jgi:hypothetical protein